MPQEPKLIRIINSLGFVATAYSDLAFDLLTPKYNQHIYEPKHTRG